MNSKRKYSEFDAGHSATGDARERTSSHQGSKFKKRRSTAGDKPTSVNWLKKRARTIERRLNREDSLPANVQHELEKELDHHKQKLNHLADGKKRGAMIKKYHMVRFFERKKADRRAKQLRTQLDSTEDAEERRKLQADLHVAEIDSLYARYFPHRERYVSLYPVSSKGADGDDKDTVEKADTSTAARLLPTERPPLWAMIEKAAKKGSSALVQIQERRLPVDSKANMTEPSKKHTDAQVKSSFVTQPEGSRKGKGKRQQASEPADTSGDEDSDGGFFEEG